MSVRRLNEATAERDMLLLLQELSDGAIDATGRWMITVMMGHEWAETEAVRAAIEGLTAKHKSDEHWLRGRAAWRGYCEEEDEEEAVRLWRECGGG